MHDSLGQSRVRCYPLSPSVTLPAAAGASCHRISNTDLSRECVAMSGPPNSASTNQHGAASATSRESDNALHSIEVAKSRAMTHGLCSLTDALRCVMALLNFLESWVIAGRIGMAELDPVAQSISEPRDRCGELDLLAKAIPFAAPTGSAGHAR